MFVGVRSVRLCTAIVVLAVLPSAVARAAVTRATVTRAAVTRAAVTRAAVTRAAVTRAPVTRAAVTRAAVTRSPQYQRALDLGVKAYVYGIPLLDENRVFETATSVNVPNGSGAGPVNQFSHFRRLTNPSDRTVVAPNNDTLYSIAWLDLASQPIVVHMPVVRGRFAELTLLDPYTEMFAAIGSVGRRAGDYAVAAPGWRGRLPRGVKVIRSPYTRVWIIGRTYIRNAADTPNVVRIQNKYALTPLDKWGTRYRPPRPRRVDRTPTEFTIPGTRSGQDPLKFFDALGDQLKLFPPPAADRPLLRQLAAVGIGPGLHPSTERRLSAALRAGLRASVAAGAAQVTAAVQRAFLTGAAKDNGWLVASTGRYGTDYVKRALVDKVGLGAPWSTVSIYPFTVTDRNLRPLTGANRYVAHFSASDLPFPVRAFWSLTLYDSDGFFVPNSAGIHLINDRSGVHYNADASLDLYIQPTAPTDPLARRNWLPSPAGKAFRLVMRLYMPRNIPGILSGRSWQPPTVLPCLSTGAIADGVACAR
jgi:hypothetical protein